MSTTTSKLGVIGGSGLYDFPELGEVETIAVETPYGLPSDDLRVGRIGDAEVVFLSRHGSGHLRSPTDVPYQANVYALKQVGVTHVVSISAVGSLRADLPPRSIVVPDQIIDRTVARPRTFFDDGVVAHVGIADPFCPNLRRALLDAVATSGRAAHDGGTHVCIEGPQFSTRAESSLYRRWDAAIIGMTSMPEARLAREAELCYAIVALVTDYDVWHDTEESVTVDLVRSHLQANVGASRDLLVRLATSGLPARACPCGDALANAIMTDPTRIREAARQRLGVIGARYLGP